MAAVVVSETVVNDCALIQERRASGSEQGICSPKLSSTHIAMNGISMKTARKSGEK